MIWLKSIVTTLEKPDPYYLYEHRNIDIVPFGKSFAGVQWIKNANSYVVVPACLLVHCQYIAQNSLFLLFLFWKSCPMFSSTFYIVFGWQNGYKFITHGEILCMFGKT